MFSTKSIAAAIAAFSLISSSAALYDANSEANLAVYWGQGPNQLSLTEYCHKTSIDIIPIGFINQFPQQTQSDVPAENFGNACYGLPLYPGTELYKSCPNVTEGIPVCQSLGKKVLLSLGGASATYQLTGAAAGIEFADYLWKAYGPIDEAYVAAGGIRPFDGGRTNTDGTTIDIDGFDFDIEFPSIDLSEGYIAMVNRLRENFLDNPSKKYIISGAPQCPIPDQNMGDLITAAQFDILWIQFYNNPACAARSWATANAAYASTNVAIDAGFNYDSSTTSSANWVDFLQGGASAGAQLFIGLPASTSAASAENYLSPYEVKNLITAYHGKAQFGGIMLWEATYAEENVNDGQTYYDLIKSNLLAVAPVTSTSTSILSTSTLASSSSSTSEAYSSTTTSQSSTSSSSKASSTITSQTSSSTESSTSVATITSSSSTSTASESTSSSGTSSSTVATSSPSSTLTTSESTSSSGTSTSVATTTSASSTGLTTSDSTSTSIVATSISSIFTTVPSTSSGYNNSTTSASPTSSIAYSSGLSSTSSASSTVVISNSTSSSATSSCSSSGYILPSGSALPTGYFSSSSSSEVYPTSSGISTGPNTPLFPASSTGIYFNTTTSSGSPTNTPLPPKSSSSVPSSSETSTGALSSITSAPVTSEYASQTSSMSLGTSTITTTKVFTISSCAPTVTNCPYTTSPIISSTIITYTTVCPVTETGVSPTMTSAPSAYTTSTVYATSVYTITSCAATVTNCPAKIGQVTTETYIDYTTVCPVTATETGGAVATPSASSASGAESSGAPAPPAADSASAVTLTMTEITTVLSSTVTSYKTTTVRVLKSTLTVQPVPSSAAPASSYVVLASSPAAPYPIPSTAASSGVKALGSGTAPAASGYLPSVTLSIVKPSSTKSSNAAGTSAAVWTGAAGKTAGSALWAFGIGLVAVLVV
ncbi:hypothetical protein BP5796_10540 [Coleophoma crateriformis]|uniref:chitinase n=1 Tax=Coleophoma crateriformis TaxID=565419 RepID=A0A3D8QQU3_9HELO|nr:hypothetical protein BP5796_10540 [Coleophoma crateriformis]